MYRTQGRALMGTFLRWVGALAILALVAGGALLLLGSRRLAARYHLAAESLELPTDPASVAEGRRLAEVYGCAGCHGSAFQGTDLIRGMPFMDLPAPNLTAGRSGGALSVGDWERAVRHGVGPDGRPLVLMPSASYHAMSDVEVGRIVAWARTLPPRESELVDRRVGPVGRLVSAIQADQILPAGVIDHGAPHPAERVPAETAAYGAYLAELCVACHGQDLTGARIHGQNGVLAPDLTPLPDGLGPWTRDDFFRFFREGIRPDGSTVGELMPWRPLGRMTDQELGALWLYLRSLPGDSL